MVRDEILYREEIQPLIAILEDAIRRSDPTDMPKMTCLGHLHLKLTAMLKMAPSLQTPEASA